MSICKLVNEILHFSEKVKEINHTLLCLIPKVEKPDNMKNFFPTSLCNVSYKIDTKLIAGKLRCIMTKLISPNQCSFVLGRHSAYNIVIMQEVVHSMRMKKGKKAWMAVKLNLEKAYDCLSWDFIQQTLVDIGLPSIIVNVINNSSVEHGYVMKRILDTFCSASRQRISKAKSRVYFSKNASFPRAKEIYDKLDFGITSDLGKYLGILLHHKRLSGNSFSHCIDRVQSILNSWNASSLSLAGRVTLAKSVLVTIPSYTIQTSILPLSVCDALKKSIHYFIWGSSPNNRRTHLVN
ncbi:uncharacterized protein LOC133310701 [Gastrolobium bilobum]|uniref:uncharacterized protein LOC133310701 n=1 Tax=Gastrolobium bilobum TaxID=150636 RepID=UPI002AB04DF3|nr:uncharacterized protein LOC133310701 [Gastrolobium bilobum]